MNQICDERPVECGDPACPCHEWSAKSPSESPGMENHPAGFLVSKPKNASEGEYGAGMTISAPDFDHEWEAAPRGMTNYVERSVAEYFYLRGLRAGELNQMIEENRVFQEMAERRRLT